MYIYLVSQKHGDSKIVKIHIYKYKNLKIAVANFKYNFRLTEKKIVTNLCSVLQKCTIDQN